jgi:hypothetical protein
MGIPAPNRNETKSTQKPIGPYAHGATDEFGFKAVEKPVHVHDLHATLLKLIGFDHEMFTYRYAGRDFRLMDVHGTVVDELIGKP